MVGSTEYVVDARLYIYLFTCFKWLVFIIERKREGRKNNRA